MSHEEFEENFFGAKSANLLLDDDKISSSTNDFYRCKFSGASPTDAFEWKFGGRRKDVDDNFA